MKAESPAKESVPGENSSDGLLVSEPPAIGTPSTETGSIDAPKDDGPSTQTIAKEASKEAECEPCKEVRFAFGRTGEYFLAIQDKERFESL